MFENFVRIGIKLTRKNGKKHVTGMPKKWQTITKSIYNGEQNYAILTGHLNDLLVIDLDNKDGFPAKEWFESNFFKLEGTSETLVTSTVSGGYHVYFKYTPTVKNKNNYQSLNVDILVDSKCVYEGKGYNIVSEANTQIRELSQSEIRLLTQRNSDKKKQKTNFENITDIVKKNQNKIGNKWIIDNPMVLRTINKNIPTDSNIKWEVEMRESSLICIPKTTMCIVSSKIHSVENHCSVFVNEDGSVIKNCFSCGSQCVQKAAAKVLQCEFKGVVLEIQKQEDNIYCRLKDEMLEIAQENQYKRDPNGNIYKRIKPYAYTFYKKCEGFVNEIFLDYHLFQQNPNNIKNLETFIKSYDSTKFPFIKPDKRYIGFNNGVLDTHTAEFITQGTDHLTVKKYLDIEFSGSTDTPLFDSIFDYQLSDRSDKEEIKEFIYFCLGRLFGIRDKYSFTLYLMGEAGCGKSLIIDVMKQFFQDIGAVSSTFEKTFGLAYLYDKDLIVCDDLPKDFSKIFPQTIFQSCISGGELSIAVKGGDAQTVNWNVPLLFAGNYNPDYVDQGQISRRIVTMNFGKNVSKKNVDTGLLRKISETELDKIALKCVKIYNEKINGPYNDKSIWSVCPEYFTDNQNELKLANNPLYRFLTEKSCYKEGAFIPISEIREIYSEWLGAKVKDLGNGTFYQVNEGYKIGNINVCKHCNKECFSGCCDNYSRNNRLTRKVVRNIEIIE